MVIDTNGFSPNCNLVLGGKHLRCFDYPFDPAFILQKKRALRRELLASEGLVPKKVAILSGSTVGEIKNILELFLLNAGIRPEFYVGGYACSTKN